MTASIELKNKVLEYIEEADDRLLRMIQALAESYREELPITHKSELDKRLERYSDGKTKFYSWEEVLDKVK